jgi:hypothetical protein
MRTSSIRRNSRRGRPISGHAYSLVASFSRKTLKNAAKTTGRAACLSRCKSLVAVRDRATFR